MTLWGFRVLVLLGVSACCAAGAVRKPLGVYVHVEASDAIGSYPGKSPRNRYCIPICRIFTRGC